MEVIWPYAIAPWEERLFATIEPGTEEEASVANTIRGIRGAIHDTLGIITSKEPITYLATLGIRAEQNPYTAKLAAMAIVMKHETWGGIQL